MGFYTSSSSAASSDSDRLPVAIACLRQGRDAQAFLLLSEQPDEKRSAARFALGLCYVHAGGWSAAAPLFEQALVLLRALTAPMGTIKNSDTYLKLATKQIKEEVYLSPLDADFCRRFPHAAAQAVTPVLIYVYKKQGIDTQARQLVDSLTGPEFESYKKEFVDSV